MEWTRLLNGKEYKCVVILESVITRILIGESQLIKQVKAEEKEGEKEKKEEYLIPLKVPKFLEMAARFEEERELVKDERLITEGSLLQE